jgi:hypothetical protein
MVLLGLQFWGDSGVSGFSPLTELIIFNLHPRRRSLIDIGVILEAFSMQALTKLALAYTEEMTMPLLERIVATYSNLRELTLLDGSSLRKWRGDVVRFTVLA